jgi:Transposase C of IS166 homeodomain
MILAQREMLAEARSEAKVRTLEIERLKLMLAKMRREKFGQSSERRKHVIEQLELAIIDLEETQAEEETKAEIAAPGKAKRKARTDWDQASAPAAAGQSATRAHRLSSALCLWQMRWHQPAQAW